MLIPATSIPAAVADPGDFYDPPSTVADLAPGDIIRTETIPLALSAPGANGPIPAHASRFMYRSNDTHGRPVAVTGLYLDPATPWTGPGQRPLVTFAVGTQGQGHQCAPSRTASSLFTYSPPLDLAAGFEMPAIELLAARGYAVVVTDYIGLGTPGVHDWLNREAEAHAVLDAARAATRLPGASLNPDAPVWIWGYSQGGGAAAAAAELQPAYAPELAVRGTFAGAPPADPLDAGPTLESSIARGYLAWLLNGLAADYPEAGPAIDAILSPAGHAWLQNSANQCDAESIATYGLTDSRTWTRTGQTVSAAIADDPILRDLLARQRIGTLTPAAPVLLISNIADDIVSHQQVVQLAADWCSHGATVQLDNTTLVPPILPGSSAVHVLTYPQATAEAIDWMTQLTAGTPAPSNCGR